MLELGAFQRELDYAERLSSLFQAGTPPVGKSQTKEGKEISNSLFKISPHKSTWGEKIYIYSCGNMCSRHWNGKIYRTK